MLTSFAGTLAAKAIEIPKLKISVDAKEGFSDALAFAFFG
jgi:hypothetical protein